MSTKVKLLYSGFNQYRKTAEVRALVEEAASNVAAAAGEGYEYDTKTMPTRVIGSVYTDSYEAMKDSAENNTLVKALNARSL